MFTTVVLILVVLLLLAYLLYVQLIQKRNSALEALSTIDVQLKQRLDLVPNILKIAKKFMEHESKLLTEITELRTALSNPYDRNNSEDLKSHISSAKEFSAKMDKLMINVENYPDLKSDATMIQAMQTYNEVEAQIAAARRFYNSNVTQLNNSVEIFPSSLVAKYVGVNKMPFFEAEAAAKEAVDANKFLS